MTMGNAQACVGSIVSQMPSALAVPSSRKLTMFCPWYVTGRVVIRSASLPAASRPPVQVRQPRMTSPATTAMRKCVSSPCESQR